MGIFLITIGVLILTPLGFPYSGDLSSLAPERFMIAVIFIIKFWLIYNWIK